MAKRSSARLLAARWENPEFVASVRTHLGRLFGEGELTGPADLRGISVGVDGPVRFVSAADLQRVSLADADMSCSTFSCSFLGSQLTSVTFAGSKFDTCRMGRARFVGCDFRGALILRPWLEDAAFRDCTFVDARLRGRVGILLSECGRRVRFERCDFSGALLRGLKIAGADFVDCRFEGTRIEWCFVFNWRFHGQAPKAEQFTDCWYRGVVTIPGYSG